MYRFYTPTVSRGAECLTCTIGSHLISGKLEPCPETGLSANKIKLNNTIECHMRWLALTTSGTMSGRNLSSSSESKSSRSLVSILTAAPLRASPFSPIIGRSARTTNGAGRCVASVLPHSSAMWITFWNAMNHLLESHELFWTWIRRLPNKSFFGTIVLEGAELYFGGGVAFGFSVFLN